MKNPSQEHLADVDRTYRLAKSLEDGVFYDEGMRPNPHVGFAKCIHGNPVFSCEECKREKGK